MSSIPIEWCARTSSATFKNIAVLHRSLNVGSRGGWSEVIPRCEGKRRDNTEASGGDNCDVQTVNPPPRCLVLVKWRKCSQFVQHVQKMFLSSGFSGIGKEGRGRAAA